MCPPCGTISFISLSRCRNKKSQRTENGSESERESRRGRERGNEKQRNERDARIEFFIVKIPPEIDAARLFAAQWKAKYFVNEKHGGGRGDIIARHSTRRSDRTEGNTVCPASWPRPSKSVRAGAAQTEGARSGGEKGRQGEGEEMGPRLYRRESHRL